MKIELGKQYQTRDGKAVRILCVDRIGKDYPVIGLIMHHDGIEVLDKWTADGRSYIGGGPDNLDLVEYNLESLEINDLIWVADIEDDGFLLQHFAGISIDGFPMTWENGRTSYTARHSQRTVWLFWKPASEKDLEDNDASRR